MIDLHCHTLLGIDDVSKDSEDILAIFRKAFAERITHVLATSYYKNEHWTNEKDLIN